jgi:ABC-type nitrate/sulfonate/bicarbonate transport system ATPase subunit
MVRETILQVQDLIKSYAGKVVIDRLSFSLRHGERLALFAPSGAGKTTLVKILTGLEVPESGSFHLEARSAGTVFQEPRLFPFLTVEENIFLPFRARQEAISDTTRDEYKRWLHVCELNDATRRYPYQLSGGMKQKVSLIRTLLRRPDFLILDEPFQSIGGDARQAMIDHLLTIQPDLSLLLITHSLEEIQALAQVVLVFPQPCLAQSQAAYCSPESIQPGLTLYGLQSLSLRN